MPEQIDKKLRYYFTTQYVTYLLLVYLYSICLTIDNYINQTRNLVYRCDRFFLVLRCDAIDVGSNNLNMMYDVHTGAETQFCSTTIELHVSMLNRTSPALSLSSFSHIYFSVDEM